MYKVLNIIKRISVSRFIFSLIFSIAIFFMSKVAFFGMVGDDNYFEDFFFSEFKILIILIPIFYAILYEIEKFINKFSEKVILKYEYKKQKKFLIISFLCILAIFMLYFFTFYPGGVFIDTDTSLSKIDGRNEFDTQQPVLYTLSLYIVKIFEPNYYTGYAILCLIQIFLMTATIVYFIHWLIKKKVNPYVVTGIVGFYMFFKLIPLYSVSIWKDTPFTLALFLLILTTVDIMFEVAKSNISIKNIKKFIIFSLLTIFLRSNGLYCVFATFLLIVIFNFKKIFTKEIAKNTIIYLISVVIMIAVVLTIEKVIYPIVGIVQDDAEMLVESSAIPIQQVARVVVVDGNISDEEKEQIEKVMSIDLIKKKYKQLIVDPIKFDKKFNKEYLYEHKNEYFKLWFSLLLKNPTEYVKAYLMETSGFWTFNVHGKEAYHSAVTWETLNDKVLNKNLISDVSNFNFKTNFLAVGEYSGGLFFWVMVLSMYLTFRKSSLKYLIGYVPAFVLWGTVMIATPMGQALRYVYILVFMVPFCLIYPFVSKKEFEDS